MNIEQTHANNFRLIRKYNLQKGVKLKHKKLNVFETIESIHPLYGWVVTDNHILRQDLSNIDEFTRLDPTVTRLEVLEAINEALNSDMLDTIFDGHNQLIPICLYDTVIDNLMFSKREYFVSDCPMIWQMCYAMKGAKPSESA